VKVRLVDPVQLDLGDLDDFEQYAGIQLLEVYEKIRASGGVADLRVKSLIALVWVCARRVDPTFTIEQARRVRPDDIEFDLPSEG
jgi:hypothetical protein